MNIPIFPLAWKFISRRFSFFSLYGTIAPTLAMSFVTSQVLEYFLNISNQRKRVSIISKVPEQISSGIMDGMQRGVTFLKGRGAYTGQKKSVP